MSLSRSTEALERHPLAYPGVLEYPGYPDFLDYSVSRFFLHSTMMAHLRPLRQDRVLGLRRSYRPADDR